MQSELFLGGELYFFNSFFALFKELISITSVYDGSDKGRGLDPTQLLFISCGET